MSGFMPGEWNWMRGSSNDMITPTDDATAQLILKRRLAQADALRGAQLPQAQMVSGHYVAPSWTQYLANAVGQYKGREQEREAIKGYQDYLGTQRKTKQDALTALSKALSPQAITEQGSYDIQVPNGRTPTPTDNLGGMQPYESGMKNISVPMTTTTGYRQPTSADVMSALSAYSNATNNPDLAEKLMMTQAGQIMAPKQTEWKEANGRLIGFDVHGRPTGEVLGESKNEDPTSYKEWVKAKGVGYKGSYEDWKRLATSWINPYQAAQLGIEEKKLKLKEVEDNPLGLPKPSAQPSTSPLNKAPKTQSFNIDGVGSVNATYDAKTGKYFVMQGGKKFWVEE